MVTTEKKNVAGKTIYAYLSEEDIDISRVVVEQNLQIIPQDQPVKWPLIQEGDQIEIFFTFRRRHGKTAIQKNVKSPYFKRRTGTGFDDFTREMKEILQRPWQ